MWIAVAFDLSVATAANRKNYRLMRKKLIGAGFLSVQKSFLWRWVENIDMANALIKRLQKFIPAEGNVVIMQIQDASFKRGIQIVDGKISPFPRPAPQLP